MILSAAFVGLRAGAAPDPGEAAFVPITPCRLFDTRPATQVGNRSTPIGEGESHVQQVTGGNGECVLPSDAVGVAMNVTAVNGTAPSFLAIYPADAAVPKSSNLNWLPGQPPTPNKVDVKLSSNGKIALFNRFGSVDVIGDVVGYYTAAGFADLQAQIDNANGAIDAVENSLSSKASRTRTVNLPAHELNTTGSQQGIYFGSCRYNLDVPGAFSYLTFDIPVGSTIDSAKAWAVAESGQQGVYIVQLARFTAGSSGTSLASVTAGYPLPTQIRSHDLTPATTEVVDAEESFAIQFRHANGGATERVAICGAQITYTLPE